MAEAKSQHFLLSKQARALSVKRITRLSDEEAFAQYVTVRFAHNGGKPFCERCKAQGPYFISTRRKWKCRNKECQRHFSPTTDTPFASRKLAYRDILIAMALFAKAPKGISAHPSQPRA
jgi:transposase-like protein